MKNKRKYARSSQKQEKDISIDSKNNRKKSSKQQHSVSVFYQSCQNSLGAGSPRPSKAIQKYKTYIQFISNNKINSSGNNYQNGHGHGHDGYELTKQQIAALNKNIRTPVPRKNSPVPYCKGRRSAFNKLMQPNSPSSSLVKTQRNSFPKSHSNPHSNNNLNSSNQNNAQNSNNNTKIAQINNNNIQFMIKGNNNIHINNYGHGHSRNNSRGKSNQIVVSDNNNNNHTREQKYVERGGSQDEESTGYRKRDSVSKDRDKGYNNRNSNNQNQNKIALLAVKNGTKNNFNSNNNHNKNTKQENIKKQQQIKQKGNKNKKNSIQSNESNSNNHNNHHNNNSKLDKQQAILCERLFKGIQFYRDLGKGAHALVRSAVDWNNKRKIAVKIYDKAQLTQQQFRSIQREVQILMSLNHPNIIKLYQTILTIKTINLVMEYGGGNSLDQYIKSKTQGHLQQKQAKIIFKQVLDAVRYLHQMNITHRDIKSQNILLNKHLSLKIIDFGFSLIVNQASKTINSYCGTPTYMAPEVVSKTPHNPLLSDRWSLGILLFCMLNGHCPFRAATQKQLFVKINKGEYQYSREINPLAKDLISKFLVKSPNQRISAKQALEHPWILST